jgi:hypothetical protein
MRLHSIRALCLMVSVLAASVQCGNSGSAGDADGGASCTGQTLCPGPPYAACVEVQDAPGHCVDWSMVGATPCAAGPQDCPTTLPSASFPGPSTGGAGAVCVEANGGFQYSSSTAPASPGYCAAIELYSDPSGAATCTPNPCGAGGYCSFIHSTAGTAIVSCMWPI